MTLMCFLHAGIPSVTVGSTTACYAVSGVGFAFTCLKTLLGLMLFETYIDCCHSILSFAWVR